MLAIAVWHGPVKSGVIDAAVTLGDASLTEKGHLMEEIIDSICIHSHSARSLIKYNLASSVSNIGFKNQIPTITYYI